MPIIVAALGLTALVGGLSIHALRSAERAHHTARRARRHLDALRRHREA